jgi:AraC-like DNA-binding protein
MEMDTAMNANGTLVEKLANSEIYRSYEQAYTGVTGMPVSLRPLETWRLTLRGNTLETPFCAMMAENSPTCAACLRMQEALVQEAMERPRTMKCAYGLWEAAVPVRLAGKTIGFLQTGQVLQQAPTAETFDRAVGKASELGVDLDEAKARSAFFRTPVASQKKMESVQSLLTIFADHLSLTSNQIAVRMANGEPPAVTKAKKFIEDHRTEDLSLGQVAKAVHTSVFYFCKLFKKSTGINFTEYVSQVRVERAKELLLDPHRRVSQVAYEAGFQSLTHFNRMFKHVAGESPTDYRNRVQKST